MPVPVREASIVWMTYRVHMCFAPSCGGIIDREREEMHERCTRDVVWGWPLATECVTVTL